MAGRIDEQNKIKVELIDLRKKIMELSEEELLERNVYLKGLLTKEIDGELIKEIDKDAFFVVTDSYQVEGAK